MTCNCKEMLENMKNLIENFKCNCCSVEPEPVVAVVVEPEPVVVEPVVEVVEEPVVEVVEEPLKKIALLIGINYLGSQSELGGCINDVENMSKMLKEQYGYQRVIVMSEKSQYPDDHPTRGNILKYTKRFIELSEKYDQFYFHYSGHGYYITDKNDEELDKKDECLVPLDYNKSGFIKDDELNVIFKNVKSKLIVVIDACHSATVLDLKYRVDCTSVQLEETKQDDSYLYSKWSYDFKLSQNPKYQEKENILTISGCRDSQTSADAWIDNKYQGALSYHFMKALKLNNYNVKIKYLLKDIHCMLKLGGYEQKPVLSSGKSINLEDNFTL